MLFSFPLEQRTVDNHAYRRVVYTNDHQQLVLMYIRRGDEISWETHDDSSQFMRVDAGKLLVESDTQRIELGDGDSVIIDAGTPHHIVSIDDCHLYIIYSPPVHRPQELEIYPTQK